MLTFGADVSCTVFHHEQSVVLHHASTWAAIAGVTVVVLRLQEVHNGITREIASDLSIDLDTAGNRAVHLVALGGYLARTLGRDYTVDVEPDRVHVEWALPR
jgi:hypothetical protein